MSIRQEARQFCEAVRSSADRNEIKSLLWTLNTGPRCHFGYLARKQHAQFLGYLLVNQERVQLEKRHRSKVSELSGRELQLLAGTHNYLAKLNRRCLEPLISETPFISGVVDPYNQYNYNAIPSEFEPIDERAADQLVSAFRKHPAYKEIVDLLPDAANLCCVQHMQAVWQMKQRLLEVGPHTIPEELWEVHSVEPEDSKRCRFIRYIGALVSVRDTLENLNQLIYQAILNDTLFELNDENIIHLGPFTLNLLGRGILITYLADHRLHIRELRDVVNVDCSFHDERLETIARIESFCSEPSPSFGEGERYDLRVLDPNLNSFGRLANI